PTVRSGGQLRKVGRIFLGRIFFTLRNLVAREDGVGVTGCLAGAAVQALFLVDVHLRHRLKLRLFLGGVDAFGRARLDAKSIFDTCVGNYISHDCVSPILDVDGAAAAQLYRTAGLSRRSVTNITGGSDIRAEAGRKVTHHSKVK